MPEPDVRLERVREFVYLADDIIDNPVARAGVATSMNWSTGADGGTGAWTFETPNEPLFRLLLIDVRNVHVSGDLQFEKVIADLRSLASDPELDSALDECIARLDANEESGALEVNGKLVRPVRIFDLFAYSEYFHRDLDKIRRVRELHPMARMVHRIEFVNFVGGLVAEVEWLRHAISVAQARGLLPELDTPRRVRKPRSPMEHGYSPAAVAGRGMMLLVHRAGGRFDFTAEEVDGELAPYGGPDRARVTASITADDEGNFVVGHLALRGPQHEPSAEGS